MGRQAESPMRQEASLATRMRVLSAGVSNGGASPRSCAEALAKDYTPCCAASATMYHRRPARQLLRRARRGPRAFAWPTCAARVDEAGPCLRCEP